MPAYSIKPTVPIINRRLAKLYGVVAAWPFSERGGTTARNAAATGNMTLSGATWLTDSMGAVVELSTSGYGTVAGSPALTTMETAASASLWICPQADLRQSTALGLFDTHPNAVGALQLLVTSSNNLRCSLGGQTGAEWVIDANWAGQWHHIVGVWSGASVTLYVDGVTKATAATTLARSVTQVDVGRYNLGNQVVAKRFAEVRLANRVWSDAEIAAQYRALYLDPFALYRQDRRNVYAFAQPVPVGASSNGNFIDVRLGGI